MRKTLTFLSLAVVPLIAGNARAAFTTLGSLNSATTGAMPYGSLTFDSAGNIYGTTSTGGANGGGTIFKYSTGSGLTTASSFSGAASTGPYGGLTYDAANNVFYGTTRGVNGTTPTAGTVFSYVPGATSVTTLHTFSAATEGSQAVGPVTLSNGVLYGTTQFGSSSASGTIFAQSATDATDFQVLASFDGSSGKYPSGRLVVSATGDIYGTSSSPYGSVFKYSGTTGAVTALTTFSNFSTAGISPYGGLVSDAAGDLFGVTSFAARFGGPTIFELAAATPTTLTTLATFNSSTTGTPGLDYENLIRDTAGDLFGTSSTGGANGFGTVWELANGSSTITTLYSFTGGAADGGTPSAGLTFGADGLLYGTTTVGGANGSGTVFAVAVPEPTSAAILVLGSVGALLCTRRRPAKPAAKATV